MELTVDRVLKQYGNKIAVDRISLKLQPGIYELLGENGAGKTALNWDTFPRISGIIRILQG